ncbi:uncharacterized protein SETTUDRAFT_30262 [Exserohilum turcica Et28A]|uniref:Uncharacterized protein n=1 Tax=Exserohilum turcicum (strain 28A) TaxID=671987 RepID=R0J483_EXST2|nr:uncharacterized protein SETTUDRAFT_30262 [Exserohilum turcica Et28A]EOA91750.1 hypothetical protein SETTUDRAFT_30262 [Exserohilum turcica Et28A]
MSSPTPGSPKAILNEDALRKNGIWFESNIKDSPKLPSWLESVRQILTCRRTKLPFDAKDDFDIDHSEMDRSEIDSKCGWDLRPKDHDFENKKQRRKSCSKNDAESQRRMSLAGKER